MNEKIKRLAEQANLRAFINPDGSLTPELHYFTESLVKECMKVADEGMAQVTMKVEWPSYHIKKHFGVE